MKINMRVFAMTVLAICISLFATSVMAQTSSTGNIEGVVIDQNGAAVPGVTVTVTSPQLLRAQTSVTDSEGRYRILNLPPGKYSVVIEESGGFGKFEQANVDVNLSSTSNVTVTLAPKGTAVTIDVTASSGATVDTANNTTGSNVSTDQFSNFPTGRTVQSLYTIAPTATRSGLRDASGRDRDPSVGGSSGPENNYILDGVNATDPAFGGSGANLPFEFVQEVEIKTGAFGAEYGKATGGIFNVITKSGTNEFHGDAFGYFTTKGLVRSVKNFPFTGAAASGFSEIDAGFDIGGPIIKDKLTFFGAFNPQRRENTFLTQTFLNEEENKITTPFYAGKLTWQVNGSNAVNLSTFGDFTKQEGFLFRLNARVPDNGFGADPNSFRGIIETGGHNYAARLNSTITQSWIAEFLFGLHYQRANSFPGDGNTAGAASQITDLFAIRSGNAIRPVTNTTVVTGGLRNAFVDGRGGILERNYVRQGFGLVSFQDRDRWEISAKFQNLWGPHTFKYGVEWSKNIYSILTTSSGPAGAFLDPAGEELVDIFGNPVPAANRATFMAGGVRTTNRFGVCSAVNATTVQCPVAALTNRLAAIVAAGQGPAGITTVATNAALTDAQLTVNPILVLNSVRARDFFLNTGDGETTTSVQSFYMQDDWKLTRNLQFNAGLRWDFQTSRGTTTDYLKLNKFGRNIQPRVGLIWDFTGKGKGKLFVNYARYLETPIPLDINVRAGGNDIQLDKNINASELNAPNGSNILAGAASGLGCLGCTATPVDPDIRPQTVNETTAGIEYEIVQDLALGFRGIYRNQGSVIEDGSFDDGTTYFLFNPGESLTEQRACAGDATLGIPAQCFGRARRYYRALEFTATKRFSKNYQFIASYVFSSLIGNYEGLFRNDNGQSDPNITSLFDLPGLLGNTYGRLPNDRPHQFKFNGSYQTPWKLMFSGNFYIQSGTPFDSLVPHPVYGENEGFGVPRGTALFPADAPGGISAGSNRTPTTHQLDLGFYYPISVGENKQLRLQLDWFNVTNAQRAVQVDKTVRLSNGIPGAGEGRFLNPFFGTGQIFQFPSALRLGVKFQF